MRVSTIRIMGLPSGIFREAMWSFMTAMAVLMSMSAGMMDRQVLVKEQTAMKMKKVVQKFWKMRPTEKRLRQKRMGIQRKRVPRHCKISWPDSINFARVKMERYFSVQKQVGGLSSGILKPGTGEYGQDCN